MIMNSMRCHSILCLLMLSLWVSAQDLQILSERDIQGTARYVGMSGAMNAIGGDPSAAKDNPAGLGVYRRMEVSLTLDEQLDFTKQATSDAIREQCPRFNASQASWVFSFIAPNRTKGVVAHNLMLSYDRLKTFNRNYTANAATESSLAQVIADKTTGLMPDALQTDSRWENSEVGWLSCMAYDTYLINPMLRDSSKWEPAKDADRGNNQLRVSEIGEVNQYAVTWAMNVSNRLFVGVGLNIQSLYYSASARYEESFGGARTKGKSRLSETSALSLSGTAFNASIGVLYHPIEMLRIGASFQTPSTMKLGMRCDGSLSSTIEDTDYPASYPPSPYSYVQSGYVLPLRASAGVALQFWNYGMLSFQYNYAHWTKNQQNDCARRISMSDVHSLRVGAEAVIADKVFINAGYAFESSFMDEDPICQLEYNTTRMDAYFRNYRSTQYVSGGLGYRGDWFLVHVAYQYRWQRLNLYAHELVTTPYDIRTDTHRIVLTLNWHMRD